MTLPVPFGPGHGAGGFDCGVAALNRGLRPVAGSGFAARFVIEDGGKVVGFYTLAAGSVRGERTFRLRRGAPEPVLKLGRLAVDRSAQGRGVGTALVMDAFARTYAVSRHTPVAALVADPPEAAAGWLEAFGFRRVPGDATTMFVALGTIEALMERRG